MITFPEHLCEHLCEHCFQQFRLNALCEQHLCEHLYDLMVKCFDLSVDTITPTDDVCSTCVSRHTLSCMRVSVPINVQWIVAAHRPNQLFATMLGTSDAAANFSSSTTANVDNYTHSAIVFYAFRL